MLPLVLTVALLADVCVGNSACFNPHLSISLILFLTLKVSIFLVFSEIVMSWFVCRLTFSIIIVRVDAIDFWDLGRRAIGCVCVHFGKTLGPVLLDKRMIKINFLPSFPLLHVGVDLRSIVDEHRVYDLWVAYSFF